MVLIESVGGSSLFHLLVLKNIMEIYALHVLRSDVDLFGPHDTSEYTIRMRNEAEKYLDKVDLLHMKKHANKIRDYLFYKYRP